MIVGDVRSYVKMSYGWQNVSGTITYDSRSVRGSRRFVNIGSFGTLEDAKNAVELEFTRRST